MGKTGSDAGVRIFIAVRGNRRFMRHSTSTLLALTCLALPALAACGGAGPYGHARTYEALSAEDGPLAATQAVSYEDVRRGRNNYAGQTVSFFGVIRHLERAEDGTTTARLEFRTLQPRNLCADETRSSCRVTVSERSGGAFTALLHLQPADQSGPQRVAPGSLLRVYGSPTGDHDEDDGPILEVSYYRHWPHAQFVTTDASVRMRR